MQLLSGAWSPASISALAAVCGSLVGALGSSVSAWLAQRHQDRRDLLARKVFHREQLYSDFISETAQAFVEAVQHTFHDASRLIPSYALLSRMRLSSTTAVVLLLFTGVIAAETPDEPYKFFREFAGLNEDQIAAIRSGRAVAKVVDSRTPDEVFVFGAVYIEATPESYLKLASDIDALRKLPNYLAIQSFSDPPQLANLDGFKLDQHDIDELKNCKPGHCNVQLPTEAIEDFQHSIDWSAPGVADRVNHRAQQMALQALLQYMQGGNTALGAYRDKSHPAVVAETFASLLGRAEALPLYLPGLHEFLLEYPKAKSDNVQTGFYWEKVTFGLKPTFRIVQRIVYRRADAKEPVYAVAEKQLYASHYFQTALDLTVCVKDAQLPGFYLITLKGSKQAGLTGLKGSIVRKVAVDKTRSSMDRVLMTIKQKLESPK